MKKILVTFLALVILSINSFSALALGPLDMEAELAVNSQYVWRGMVANDEAVLQPALSASFLGFGLGFWGNVDLSDVNGYSGEFNEVDWILTYGLPLPMVDLEFGLIYYDFPNTEATATAEAYVSGSMGILLSPSLEIYYDFKEVDGSYINAGISHGLELSEGLNLDLGANLGFGDSNYNTSYFGVDSSSASDFLLSASMPFHPIPFFTITPSVNYSMLMGDNKEAVDDSEGNLYKGSSDAVFYGISASFSF
ncbi:MAG: hypothetical protein GY780_13405 [bacterium]|nr:hypothetical protein [bacterium]